MTPTEALAQALTEAGEPARVGIYAEAESLIAAMPEGWHLVKDNTAEAREAVVEAARAIDANLGMTTDDQYSYLRDALTALDALEAAR